MKTIMSTKRLLLREIGRDDLPALGRIYSDDKCMRYYPSIKSPSEIDAWFETLAFQSYAQNGFGLWAMVDRVSNEVLGDCGITLQETPAGTEPEIGYHLWREFWGKGFASEAALACRGYALGPLGFERVVSITSPENIPSQAVARRVHDRLEIYKKWLTRTNSWVDRHLYISGRGEPNAALQPR